MTGLFLGLVGAIVVLIAYVRVTFRHISVHSRTYYICNLVGVVMIAASMLIGEMNWGSFLLQIFWGLVSVRGLLDLMKGEN